MASTEKAEEQAFLPPDAFEYINSIKRVRPELFNRWKASNSFDSYLHIPPPSHRVMVYKAELEHERILKAMGNVYARLPSYKSGCFKELLQWLNRFDFAQDDEVFFGKFITEIMGEGGEECDITRTPILQTQTHKFFLLWYTELTPMTAALENKSGIADVKNEKLMKVLHEFNPALQVERDSDTEERVLPLRFGLPVGPVACWKKGERRPWDEKLAAVGYTPFHLVFHPIDKSFWMVVDRYLDYQAWDPPDDVEPEFQTNELVAQTLGNHFGTRKDIMVAEAFRLGTKDIWFLEEEKQARQLDGGVGFDGNESEELVSRFDCGDSPPTIDFSSLPKVSLFRDTDPPQVQFAAHTRFQSYLAENGVVKGRSWLSVSPVDN
ncbi:uncharacterized protein Z520_07022 [Fonsecaea multimorphosa CBS 102226]|uniref:Uncharacterized protein n=1 Tax=Fonsecaea multimorphosa CBS 102226 TaxID=1442371 RepID=A0A0D2K363_9EURO|nr:uncharacterized protein Z520_07022 [Fonsecaea multimorphosa CBS 102226]KIX97569.1 hypothetical protein Z520_07022 [Fonsecaea multimorphosa CBS 102226]OAL23526.1 hypothetical protein AYO22_06576 [Fonsecaea multimorphosa]